MRLNTPQKAQLAISNRLFVNGWTLREDLMQAVKWPAEYDVKLEYRKGKPIAVALLRKCDGLISIFVRKNCRRKGIGTKLIKRFKDKVNHAGYGVVGSREFYASLNVRVDW